MRTVSLSQFGHLTSAKELVNSKALDGELPTIEQVLALATWSEEMLTLWDTPVADVDDRSSGLMRMAYFGAEQGWTDPQIMTMLKGLDDRWGKYTTRRDREHRYLVPMINRARQKHGYAGSLTDLALGALMLKQTEPEIGEDKLVYGFDEFVNTHFKIDWLLEDLFAVGGFGLLVAHPGVGKTTLAMQMGAYLALGRDAFMRWPNKGGSKKVLFLSLEMGPTSLNHFMTSIIKHYPGEERELGRNFRVSPLGSPVPLDGEQGQAFLNNMMDTEKPDVLIIDSLQKVSSKELTDEQAVKNLIHYLSSLRKKYKTSLLVIHHNRKKPNDQQKKNVELSDVYGSTYITTDADFVMNLHTEAKHTVRVTMVKNRLGEVPDPFDIYRDDTLSFSMEFADLEKQFGRETEGVFSV